MYALTNKPEMGLRLYSVLIDTASEEGHGVDAMKLIQLLAGVLVETYLVFDQPDEAMMGSLDRLSSLLGTRPLDGRVAPHALPPAHILDCETEKGRTIARLFLQDWLDCEFEYHDFILTLVQASLVSWENEGVSRAKSLRLLHECVRRCMAFEIAAQELCDVVIERKVSDEGWGLGDCVASLSAVAGRRLAQSSSVDGVCRIFRGSELPDNLDRVVYVMTQEAVRLGVPAGSDWRFGLAANDVPVNAPINLINGIEPYCQRFFALIGMTDLFEQSVSCAKAAGRMLAVASGGELPELEPAIAKPLAMAALTESYKSVCMGQAIVSC